METMTNRFLRVRKIDLTNWSCPRSGILVLICLISLGAASSFGSSAVSDTLVLVNGDPITALDLDEMIMLAHRSEGFLGEGSGVVDRLLKKRINDHLIIQDAMAAGMDQEPELVALAEDRRHSYAVRAYAGDMLKLPSTPEPDSVKAYFERYYWQIQIRRISVRTWQEASDLKMAVLAGADMDSLARKYSLDSKVLTGGLYNLLHWVDIENRIRDQVGHLEVGEFSEIFPYNDAYSFARVEQRFPVDWESFARFENRVTSDVLELTNQRLWEEFVDEHIAAIGIEESMAGLAAIIADSSLVLKGEFLKEDSTPVIQVKGGRAVSGTELRQAVSHEVMQNGLASFNENLERGRRKVTSELVLGEAARQAGYFEDPVIEGKVAKDLEKALIEAYLADTVGSQITFKRTELAEFYEENKEKFRGPDEVQLDIMILQDRADAEEAARRLADGADFGFIFSEYNPGQEVTHGQSRYIKIPQLSNPFQDELKTLKEGESSPAIEMPMGWMVFKLVDRRPGAIPPQPTVEMEIRRVVYQEKFNALLDDHLDLLKEHSEIIRFEDKIEAYILAGEEES